MDRFRALTIFLKVAETGAFNAAARALDLSPAAVTRAVMGLEAGLGVTLFTRTTRRVALTDAGRRLAEDAAQILAALAAAEQSARGAHALPVGELCLTAPVLFGQRFIAPILRRWLDRNPAMRARVQFLDRNVDLIEEGFDLALRIGTLPDSSLTARKIGTVRQVVVAAPAYLSLHGRPETPEELRAHSIVLSTAASGQARWRFRQGGTETDIALDPRLKVNTMSAAIDAALAGWGVTRTLSYQVTEALGTGRLVEIGADWDDRVEPVHLLHSEGRRAAAKIRSFVDFAAAEMSAHEGGLLAR